MALSNTKDGAIKLLRQVIKNILGSSFKAITAQSNTPRPNEPHCTILLSNVVSPFYEERTLKNIDNNPDYELEETISDFKEYNFSLNFYRDDSWENAQQVKLGLMRNSSNFLMKQGGFSIGNRSDVRDLSFLLPQGYEQRHQLDITLHSVLTDTDLLKAIEAVLIEGTINGEDITVDTRE